MRWTRLIFLAWLALAATLSQAAGLRFIDIPAADGERELKGAVWYPCSLPPADVTIGPYRMSVTRDCPLEGNKLPLVIISHGWAGNFLGHRDLAETLADAGFIVVAVNHGDSSSDGRRNGDFSVFIERPLDIRRTIDFMLSAWPQANQVDAARIGLFGFSRGGYTGLVAIGARPLFGRRPQVCEGRDTPVCRQAHNGELPEPVHDPRIKAAVIADPLSVFFTAQSFANVKVPVQLWGSERGGDGVTPESVAAIPAQLSGQVEFHSVPNSQHFSFLPPCSAALANVAPEICSDAAGFDRAAFHREMDRAALDFFQKHLPVSSP